jgi:hypothetical protein
MRILVQNRLRRLRVLRSVKAPEWIIRSEQVFLLSHRYDRNKCFDLMEKRVRPIMGQGSITVPDGEGK